MTGRRLTANLAANKLVHRTPSSNVCLLPAKEQLFGQYDRNASSLTCRSSRQSFAASLHHCGVITHSAAKAQRYRAYVCAPCTLTSSLEVLCAHNVHLRLLTALNRVVAKPLPGPGYAQGMPNRKGSRQKKAHTAIKQLMLRRPISHLLPKPVTCTSAHVRELVDRGTQLARLVHPRRI